MYCTQRYTVESVSVWENIKGTCLSNETFPLSQHSQQIYICMYLCSHVYILLVLSPPSHNVSCCLSTIKETSMQEFVWDKHARVMFTVSCCSCNDTRHCIISCSVKNEGNNWMWSDAQSCMRKYFLFAYFCMSLLPIPTKYPGPPGTRGKSSNFITHRCGWRETVNPLSSGTFSGSRGRILERNWDKSFPLCFSQSPLLTDFIPPPPPPAIVVWNRFVMLTLYTET